MMRYAVVIEMAGANYSAYVPDLPGCVATGETWKKQSGKSARPCGFILRGLGRMACRQPNRGRLWPMSKPKSLLLATMASQPSCAIGIASLRGRQKPLIWFTIRRRSMFDAWCLRTRGRNRSHRREGDLRRFSGERPYLLILFRNYSK